MGSLRIHHAWHGDGPSYERPASRMKSSISYYVAVKLIAS